MAAPTLPVANMDVPLSRDFLTDEAYTAKFDTENPNRELIQSLAKSGVRFYICDQMAMPCALVLLGILLHPLLCILVGNGDFLFGHLTTDRGQVSSRQALTL